jgi:hypothetical protein
MEIAIVLFILLVGPLAALFGQDSRLLDEGPDRRGWFPATRRR